MIAALLLVGLQLRAVVDQMDGDWASVEWRRTGEAGWVPVHLLPPGTTEGDAIRVRLRPGPQPTEISLPTTVHRRDWRARVALIHRSTP